MSAIISFQPVYFLDRAVIRASSSSPKDMPSAMLIGGYGPRGEIAVSEVATEAGARPVFATNDQFSHILLHALGGDILVASGESPTASQTQGLLIRAGEKEALPMRDGERLSFVLRAEA